MGALYEDADVVAVAKPAGIAVIPGRDETLPDSLRGRLEESRGERLWVVHRLDRDTSGVVLFARNEEAHRRLSMAFESRAIKKVYDAWTRGRPLPDAGTIEVPLHPARKGKMRPATAGEPGSLPSLTVYETLSVRETALGPVAHVEAHPHSGRQHQIRVHLRAASAPLLVDPLYGRCERLDAGALGPDSPELARLTLHARSLTFQGAGGVTRTIKAPWPEDLRALEAWLRASPPVPTASPPGPL